MTISSSCHSRPSVDRSRLAVSGTEFRGSPLDSLLRFADDLAVGAVELWCPGNLGDLDPGRVEEKVSQWSGTVVAVSAGVEMGGEENIESATTSLVDAIDLAHRLGAGRVNTYFGAPGFRDDVRSGRRFLDQMQRALARAEECGVRIVLENEFNAFGRDDVEGDLTRRPDALASLLQTADSPWLRLNFDPANFLCAGVEPFPHAYSVLRDLIDYVHVKDVRTGSADELSGWVTFHDYDRAYSTTELGAGEVDWPGLLRALEDDGYAGYLTLEPHVTPEHRRAAFAQAASWLSPATNVDADRRVHP